MEFDITDKVVKDKESFKKMMDIFFICMIAMFGLGGVISLVNLTKLKEPIFLIVPIGLLLIAIVMFICWRIVRAKDYKSTSIRYRLEGDEATYFLFQKKISPCCNAKMKKVTEKILQSQGLYNAGDEENKIMAYGDVYRGIIKYTCPTCNKIYTIQELVNSNKLKANK